MLSVAAAEIETTQISPPDRDVARIRNDYRDMREIFIGEAPRLIV
jgi:hypothetical protein